MTLGGFMAFELKMETLMVELTLPLMAQFKLVKGKY
tara:strand:+ start:112 stop:219 length:108 start_codon:yes stop_codon:yes gene_type:complete